MPYSRPAQANVYDCDVADRLKLSAAMQYMQQTSSEHLASIGVPPGRLFADGLVFLLVKSCLKIHRMPRIGEEFRVLTAPVATKGVRFVREFAMDQPDGKRLISACTLWVLVDTGDHTVLRPNRLPYPLQLEPSFLNGAVGDEPLQSGEGVPIGSMKRTVRYSHLDHNRHVNNCIYADFILDALPYDLVAAGELESLTLHFQHEAALGQEIDIIAQNMENNVKTIHGTVEGRPCFAANVVIRPPGT